MTNLLNFPAIELRISRLLRKLTAALLMISVAGLLSCSTSSTIGHGNSQHQAAGGLQVAATFGPNGRLWRLWQDKRHVYVDYSDNRGQTFSTPTVINADAQRIKVSTENRLGIAADNANRIYLIYPAEGDKQPAAVYFSVSADGGAHFSPPAEISDKAAEANAFQGRLALSPKSQAYVFWHDERDRSDWKQAGNAIYYTTLDAATHSAAPSRRAENVLCECCKIAAAFKASGQPVLLARFVYPGGIRDHGLIKQADNGQWNSWRVTFDDWHIEACPEHGPALAIGSGGDYHIAWFTQGSARQGIFYAHSSDHGQHFSEPMPLGTASKLPSHPDVLVLGEKVFLAWSEYDGTKTQIFAMQSQDGGAHWSAPRAVAETSSEADIPLLLHDGKAAFLSWNTKGEGYRLIPVENK